MKTAKLFRRLSRIALVLVLLAGMLLPAAHATKREVVRVGWHEVPYFITDSYGRLSGYSYDYQCKIAAYTGWTYVYVEAGWSELLQMLADGEIDMLANVSYLPERAEQYLYASAPMGTEAYYVFAAPDNGEITAEDYTSLSGKRVGVAKDSFQKSLFLSWAETHGLSIELVETTTSEEESLRLLGTELDAFVTMDFYGKPELAVPIAKIGSSDFYFAVSKSRPDLLVALDAAMNRIQDENKYFNQQLHEQYLRSENADRYLTASEQSWLAQHGTIRVGYQDNYLAFCASDEHGALTGALKDYLAFAATSLENAELQFEAISFPTAAAAMEALAKGEVDCVFPANLTNYDSESMGVVMSPALMRTEMDAVVRADAQKAFVRKEAVTVAVNEGNTNYDMFLADHFPTWNRAYFVNTPAGLDAVAAGDADCVIISNYRFSNISKQCEKLHLATVYTGVDMDYCFALRQGDTELYSILARVIGAVPDSLVHTALTYYSTEDVRVSLLDVLRDNMAVIAAAIALVAAVILALLLRSARAEKRARNDAQMVQALNRRVFVDSLTNAQNKAAFDKQLLALQQQLDAGETPEFAVAVFDCDDLKQINDRFGHEKGDLYLKEASSLIGSAFRSTVYRIGGDEFSVILLGEDYRCRDALVSTFYVQQASRTAAAKQPWEEVHVSLGVAAFDQQNDTAVSDTVRRADKIMYESKRLGKTKR